MKKKINKQHFHTFTPESALNDLEASLGRRLSNLCRPLNSYINRVYELMDNEGVGFIVKFYRPGRWSRQAILDEHEFLLELHEAEVPVIPPVKLNSGSTIGEYREILFSIFPKKGGRTQDEFNEDQWLELGRLIARTHNIGEKHPPCDRIILAPDRSTKDNVDYLLDGNFIPPDLKNDFEDAAKGLITEISPYFDERQMIRIHGDCHFGNLIYRPGESFFLIDLDDMATGPPVQDLWMLLPDTCRKSLYELDLFMEGYETFRPFDRRSLKLIEPLRAMRFIHFAAWCARQKEDGETLIIPDWGSSTYWRQEIDDLNEQRQRIISGEELPDFLI